MLGARVWPAAICTTSALPSPRRQLPHERTDGRDRGRGRAFRCRSRRRRRNRRRPEDRRDEQIVMAENLWQKYLCKTGLEIEGFAAGAAAVADEERPSIPPPTAQASGKTAAAPRTKPGHHVKVMRLAGLLTRPGAAARLSLLNHRTAALGQRAKGFIGRDRLVEAVVDRMRYLLSAGFLTWKRYMDERGATVRADR